MKAAGIWHFDKMWRLLIYLGLLCLVYHVVALDLPSANAMVLDLPASSGLMPEKLIQTRTGGSDVVRELACEPAIFQIGL